MMMLRPVTDADFAFLYGLHRAVMQEYVAATWGWVEAWQAEYFKRKWDPDKWRIIQVEGQDAGVWVVEEREGELYLGLIEITAEFQGQGVGTAVIQNLLAAAQAQNRAVSLHVLKANTRARQLYERLGFAVVAEETYRFKMRWTPLNLNGANNSKRIK
ncbi:MAG: GNAT family N-acetyltransferase [Chloroflexota bacterium]